MSIILIKLSLFSKSPLISVITFAKYIIIDNFISSDGWNITPLKVIHLLAPLEILPANAVTTTKVKQTIKKYCANLLYTLYGIKDTKKASSIPIAQNTVCLTNKYIGLS